MRPAAGQSWYEEYYAHCTNSSLASIPNVSYQPNGESIYGVSHHRIFRIANLRSGKEVKLYGIIDGFEDGKSVMEFVADRLVSEILPPDVTGPHVLNNDPSDCEIRKLLEEAFRRVDSAYFSDSIGEILAMRCAQQMCSGKEADLGFAADQIKGFATAIIALIYDDKLFVANLGDSRAIIIRKVEQEFKVSRICNWHHPSDDKERKRLKILRLNPDCVDSPTRCFGDFFRKGGYKEVPELSSALGEPVLADPSVRGPVQLDVSMRYLVLMNGGVVKTVTEQDKQANIDVKIAGLVLKEGSAQFTSSVVARAALDTLAREHEMAFTQSVLPSNCTSRRDLDMLVIFLSQITSSMSTPNSTTPVAIFDSDADERDSDLDDDEDELFVKPYVDCSAFFTHPLKNEVTRNIERIRSRYNKEVDSLGSKNDDLSATSDLCTTKM